MPVFSIYTKVDFGDLDTILLGCLFFSVGFNTNIVCFFVLCLMCVVLRDRNWCDIPWKKVVVGDIVKVVDRHFFPADLVLLASRYVWHG